MTSSFNPGGGGGGGFGLEALGTVTTVSTLPPQDGAYTVATAMLTAADACAFTLPSAVGGYAFTFYVTNPATSVISPTFQAAAGQTLTWLAPVEWVMATGAVNAVYFESSANGVWEATPLTSALGVAAPLQEQIDYQATYGASYSIPSPLVPPYQTIVEGVLSANLTLTLPTPAAGMSLTVFVDQPTGGSYTLTVASAAGAVRWATSGGTPPVAPAAGKRLWLAFVADNGPQWQGSVVYQGY